VSGPEGRGSTAGAAGQGARRLPRPVHDSIRTMQQLLEYFRKNPQVLVLLIICVVLGIGTFLAVVISLISSGSTKISGEPSGAIALASALLG
jgi:hypothetical protein